VNAEQAGQAGGFLAASVRVATPLMLAATGETITERAGIINLSIEGCMLSGALAAAMGAAWGNPWWGILAAAGAGLALAVVFASIVVGGGVDQIIAGMALTLGAVGVTGAAYRAAFGPEGVGLSLPTFPPSPVPGFADVPVIGTALFDQSVLSYLAYFTVLCGWFLLYRTRWGLALRATGESIEAARAAGVPVQTTRFAAVLVGGGLGGLAGGSLVLAQVGTFAERMTAGRGFIAIAIVALGGWHPLRVALASLFFGGTMALQFVFQAAGLSAPYQLFLMLPYLVTLFALAGFVGRLQPPSGLGKG